MRTGKPTTTAQKKKNTFEKEKMKELQLFKRAPNNRRLWRAMNVTQNHIIILEPREKPTIKLTTLILLRIPVRDNQGQD